MSTLLPSLEAARALFKVPVTLVTLQANSGLIETGWTPTDQNTSPPPHITADNHVTLTKQTSGGTVAVKHNTEEEGELAFDPNEISPAYTDKFWAAVRPGTFETWCPVAS
jgi:hypothetical protein